MNLFSASILGIIQGLTEFLPISSSGHLVLIQKLIPNFSQPGVLFDVVLHLGTTAAVLYYFRKSLLSMKLKYLYLLGVGTIPAILAGLLFREKLEDMFSSDRFLGVEFIITGILNFLVDLPVARKAFLNTKNSLLIGIAQAVAIIPAISRSGLTIFAGVSLGINKKEVAQYSFLLSIPVILGANILEIITHRNALIEGSFSFYSAGFITASIIGFLSIGILLKLLSENKFKYFGFYSIVLGVLVMLFF